VAAIYLGLVIRCYSEQSVPLCIVSYILSVYVPLVDVATGVLYMASPCPFRDMTMN